MVLGVLMILCTLSSVHTSCVPNTTPDRATGPLLFICISMYVSSSLASFTCSVYLKHSAVSRCRLWGQRWPGVRNSSSCCSRRVRAVKLALDQQRMWVWRSFATAGCCTSLNLRMWEKSGPEPVLRWEELTINHHQNSLSSVTSNCFYI